jgi:hypothetical protein
MRARTSTMTREEPAMRVVIRHPVRLWRYHLAQDYDVRTMRTMRASLARIAIVGERHWATAATGDAAAAVAVAFRHARGDDHRLRDLSMTALALAGLGGSTAACVVMAKMLRA